MICLVAIGDRTKAAFFPSRPVGCTIQNLFLLPGAQDNKVHEHLGLNLSLGGRSVISFEIEAYPEPEALSPSELQGLVARYGKIV